MLNLDDILKLTPKKRTLPTCQPTGGVSTVLPAVCWLSVRLNRGGNDTVDTQSKEEGGRTVGQH